MYKIIDKDKIPYYKLYDMKIMNKNKLKLEPGMSFDINISSFFDKNDHHRVYVEVSILNMADNVEKKTKINRNDKIIIIFNSRNIKFTDVGIINKIIDTDTIIVKNSFNRLLKCKIISNEAAEVIQ